MDRRKLRTLVTITLVAAVWTVAADPAAAEPGSSGFGMPMDAGTRYIAQRAEARADIARLEPQVAPAVERRDELQRQWDELGGHLQLLDAAAARAAELVAAGRDRVAATAADVYVHGGTARTAATLEAVTGADEVLDVSRHMRLLESFGQQEIDKLEVLLGQADEIEGEIVRVGELRDDVRTRLDEAIARADEIRGRLDAARDDLQEAQDGIVRFHRLATNEHSPIMGPSLLSPGEMAAFVRASGNRPELSVSLEQLAQIFLEEGAKVGVRGDVAWAQSILETGWFTFANSMVEPEDNNYAGVGACDSCDRGYQFDSAREGVRAQVQLLRIYVDREVHLGTLPDRILLPGSLRLGFRGKVKSWWDLTERWATADDYGLRIYQLYNRMVAASGGRP